MTDDEEYEEKLIADEINQKNKSSTDPSEIFTEQKYISKARLLTSDFKDIVLEMISNSTLSYQCKSSLAYVVFYGFDKNSVLAKTQDVDMKKIDFEISMNIAKLSYKKTDTKNPELSIIETTIKNAYNDFASRSAGGWERGLQNTEQMTSETTINRRDVTKDGKPLEKKRGFNFNPFGGGS